MMDIRKLEPGFFSSISVSPELTLSRVGLKILALIGNISDLKLSVYEINSSNRNLFEINKYFRIKHVIANGQPLLRGVNWFYANVAKEPYLQGNNPATRTLRIHLVKFGGTEITKTYSIPENASTEDIIAYSDSDIEFSFDSSNKLIIKVLNPNAIRCYIGNGDANQMLKIEEGGFNAIMFNGSFNALVSVFEYRNENDYQPIVLLGVDNFERVKHLFYTFDDSSNEENIDFSYNLAFGLKVAIENGSSNFIIVPIKLSPTMTEEQKANLLRNALEQLEKYYPTAIVPLVPLNEVSSLGSMILNHVTKMSSMEYRGERIAVLGLSDITNSISLEQWNNFASQFRIPGFEDKRIILVYPAHCRVVDLDGNSRLCDGTILAAAFAGKLLSLPDEAETMTNKTIEGVSIDTPEINRLEKNYLTNSGITVIEYSNNILKVRRALTVSQKTIAEQEISIVMTFDTISNTLRTSLENLYVGTKIIPGVTINNIATSARTILENFVVRGMISKYDVKVEQDRLEPRRVNIEVKASPVYTLIWGVINITITL
ncbi:MAG: hypothetical protein QXD43_01615 [Candidatus Aenigmatarchaeota archaeon]